MTHKNRYDCKNCGAVFTYDKIKIHKRDYGGIAFNDRVCPYCGSMNWSSFVDRQFLDKFVYPLQYADF